MSIATFQGIEGGIAVLSIGGRYNQFPLYRRGETIFAEVKGSYVKLGPLNRTSVPNITWHDIEDSFDSSDGLVVFDRHQAPVWQFSTARAAA